MNEYQKLIDIVEKEAKTVEDLLEAMKKKQKSIISMTLETMQSSISEEIRLLSITRSLEKERIQLVQNIIPETNAPSKISMADMLKYFPDAESEKLTNLKIRLKNSLEEVKHVNETNRVLLERGKKFVKDNISILTSHGEKKLVNKKV